MIDTSGVISDWGAKDCLSWEHSIALQTEKLHHSLLCLLLPGRVLYWTGRTQIYASWRGLAKSIFRVLVGGRDNTTAGVIVGEFESIVQNTGRSVISLWKLGEQNMDISKGNGLWRISKFIDWQGNTRPGFCNKRFMIERKAFK